MLNSATSTLPCTEDGCEKPRRARGLCSTHYNRTQPNRHAKVTVACDECGQPCTKDERTARYAHAYCSYLCRDYARWGARSSELPADHMARWTGRSCEWIAPPIPEAPELPAHECVWCGHTFRSPQPHAKVCSDGCRRRRQRATRRGREHDAIGTYTWADITRLWLTFDRACAYCHISTPLTDIQAEHVTPLSRGGANNLTNLLPSCSGCNSDKRDLPLTQWAADRARRGLPPVTTTWSPHDTRYAHLTQGRTDLRTSA